MVVNNSLGFDTCLRFDVSLDVVNSLTSNALMPDESLTSSAIRFDEAFTVDGMILRYKCRCAVADVTNT